jgi:hypothetical protein
MRSQLSGAHQAATLTIVGWIDGWRSRNDVGGLGESPKWLGRGSKKETCSPNRLRPTSLEFPAHLWRDPSTINHAHVTTLRRRRVVEFERSLVVANLMFG